MNTPEAVSLYKQTLEEIFSDQNAALSFFRKTCVRFYGYDYRNQLLIYAQSPDASGLAGHKAWEALGETVREQAKPTFLLYPNFQEAGQYKTVRLFDDFAITRRDKAAKHKPETEHLIQSIQNLTQFYVRSADAIDLDDYGVNGRLDFENRELLINEKLSDEDYRRELLGLYTEYLFTFLPDTESFRIAQLLVRIITETYFGFPERNVSMVFLRSISDRTPEAKEWLLNTAQKMASLVIEDLSGTRLSFEETALANSLVQSDALPTIRQNMLDFMNERIDRRLSMVCSGLLDKLMHCSPDTIRALYEKISTRTLYTYPPWELSMVAGSEYRNTRLHNGFYIEKK